MTIRIHFGQTLLAEWTKIRTVRTGYAIVLATAAITVALGFSLLVGILQRDDRMSLAQRAGLDPAGQGIWLHGLDLGQVVLAVLGVLVATSEYGTGTIRGTLAATPGRWRVLAAKAVGLGNLALVVGAVLAAGMLALALPLLHQHGLPLDSGTAMRTVAFAALATAGIALLGLATGLLIRHTAGALTTLLVVLLGIPVIEPFFPDGWSDVLKYFPAESAWAMFTPDGAWLSLGPATAVLSIWVGTALAAAAITFHRRDA